MNILRCSTGVECSAFSRCPLVELEGKMPGIPEHIRAMVGKFGLEGVANAYAKQKQTYDFMDYELMRSLAGSQLVNIYEDGATIEQETLAQVLECHGYR